MKNIVGILIVGGLSLFAIPQFHDIWDELYLTILPALGVTMTGFTDVFFASIPYIALLIVILGTVYKLLHLKRNVNSRIEE